MPQGELEVSSRKLRERGCPAQWMNLTGGDPTRTELRPLPLRPTNAYTFCGDAARWLCHRGQREKGDGMPTVLGAANPGGALLLLVFIVFWYCLPTIVAARRKVGSTEVVFWTNLLAGWTIIGWVFALALAVRVRTASRTPVRAAQLQPNLPTVWGVRARPTAANPPISETRAGASALEIARRAEAKAARLRDQADSLERYASGFRAGAEGERALHSVLGNLTRVGWHSLPDRRSPTGGNIDELLVGPAGVAVLDAKKWSYPLRIRGDHLYTGRYPRNRELDHLVELVVLVRRAILDPRLGTIDVRGFMVLCGDVDRNRAAEEVKGIWVCGLDILEQGFAYSHSELPPAMVWRVFTAIERAFPPS